MSKQAKTSPAVRKWIAGHSDREFTAQDILDDLRHDPGMFKAHEHEQGVPLLQPLMTRICGSLWYMANKQGHIESVGKRQTRGGTGQWMVVYKVAGTSADSPTKPATEPDTTAPQTASQPAQDGLCEEDMGRAIYDYITRLKQAVVAKEHELIAVREQYKGRESELARQLHAYKTKVAELTQELEMEKAKDKVVVRRTNRVLPMSELRAQS